MFLWLNWRERTLLAWWFKLKTTQFHRYVIVLKIVRIRSNQYVCVRNISKIDIRKGREGRQLTQGWQLWFCKGHRRCFSQGRSFCFSQGRSLCLTQGCQFCFKKGHRVNQVDRIWFSQGRQLCFNWLSYLMSQRISELKDIPPTGRLFKNIPIFHCLLAHCFNLLN